MTPEALYNLPPDAHPEHADPAAAWVAFGRVAETLDSAGDVLTADSVRPALNTR
jgi:hypothetical protein